MFDNIGGKIKVLAIVGCWIGIISSIISGIAMMVEDEDLVFLGFLVMAIGSLVSWTSSFVLYGFGELIENSEATNSNTYEIRRLLMRIAPEEKKEPVKSYLSSTPTSTVNKTSYGSWVCKKCGTSNDANAIFCKDCGTYK